MDATPWENHFTQPSVPLLEWWKPLAGFEGYYEVSSVARFITARTNTRTWRGRILKPCLDKQSGRYNIVLWKEGKTYTLPVAKLVALTFYGPCPPGKEINHINGFKGR